MTNNEILKLVLAARISGGTIPMEIKQYAEEHNLSDIVAMIKEAEELAGTTNPAVQDLREKLYEVRIGKDIKEISVLDLISAIAVDLGVKDDFPKFENKVAQDAGALDFKENEIKAMNTVFAKPEVKNAILVQAQSDINRFRGKKDAELNEEEIGIRNTAQVVESTVYKFDAMAELLKMAAEVAVTEVKKDLTEVATEVKKDVKAVVEQAQDFESYVLNKVKNNAVGITVENYDSEEGVKPTTMSGAILAKIKAEKTAKGQER